MMSKWIPSEATHFYIEDRAVNSSSGSIQIYFIRHGKPSGWKPVAELSKELAIADVCKQIKDKPLESRITPRNKYSREIKPDVWVDVYDVLAAFTGRVSERCKPAIDHALKKLLAPGLRGVKAERQDLVEARDSIDRAISQIDEWA